MNKASVPELADVEWQCDPSVGHIVYDSAILCMFQVFEVLFVIYGRF